MKCPKCKKKIEEGQQFCGYCGTPLPESPKKKTMYKRLLHPACVAGVCCVVILGAVLATNLQQTSASKLEKKIEAGNRYLQSADYEKAEVAFNEALSIDEKSPEAALGLAKVCNEKEDPEGALNYLKLANENLEDMSTKQVTEQKLDWSKKSEDYQKTYDATSQLFKIAGNEKQAQYVQEEKEKTEKTIQIIIQVKQDSETESKSKKQDTGKDIMDQAIGDLVDQQDPIEEDADDSGETNSGGGLDETSAGGKTASSEMPGESEGEDGSETNPEPAVTQTEDPAAPTEVLPAPTEVPPTPTEAPPAPTEAPPTPTEAPPTPTEVPPTPTEVPPTPTEEAETYLGIPVATEDGTYTPEDNGEETDPSSEWEESPGDQAVYDPGETSGEEAGAGTQGEDDTDAGMYVYEEDGTVYVENGEGNTTDTAADHTEAYPEESIEESAEESIEESTDSEASPSEVLQAFADENIWPVCTQILSQTVTYDYEMETVSGMDGILGLHEVDLDKDGVPELLAIRTQAGQIVWDIYRVNGSAAELVSTTVPSGNGFGTAMADLDYEMSQVCFLVDRGESVQIGVASNYRNMEEEEGTPSVRTNVELYDVTSVSCDLAGSATILNGRYVYSGTDRGSAEEGGSDSFITRMSAMGLSGSWITESTAVLDSMDLPNNPGQDTSAVPDPLAGGIAAKEAGTQDLVILEGDMTAGSGSLRIQVTDNTQMN